jgi:hypothetical protein
MENAIIDKLKMKMSNIKMLSEELQVQMALGKKEALDLIEKEKKTFSKYINEQKTHMDKLDLISNEHKRDFLTILEDLESKLNVAMPKDNLRYDEYKNDLLNKIYKVEEVVRLNYQTANDVFQKELESFKAKMDAYRVNLALHDKDNPEKVANLKHDFTTKLSDLRIKLSKHETDESKIDNFVEDLSESYEYLKKAISNLAN